MKSFSDLRKTFKIFRNNPGLVYLDYSATTFMPDSVMNKWIKYHSEVSISANRNRSSLGIKAINYLEDSRRNISNFFNSNESYDLIFTKNATESLNIIANGFGELLNKGDIILLSSIEHHSNIIPWQKVAEKNGAIIVLIPLKDDGSLDYEILDLLKGQNVKIVSLSLVSNVTGYQIDHKKIKKFVDQEEANYILDISQAVAHMEIDLSKYNADAYALSAHKMYGPKNIGGLFLKKKLTKKISPYIYGGGMVWNFAGPKKEWAEGHKKFEAGTFDVGLAYAWSHACDFIKDVSFERIEKVNRDIYQKFFIALSDIKDIELVKNGDRHLNSLLSFQHRRIHSHDLEEELSKENIVLRTGHMCSQNTLRELEKVSLNRISWGIGVTNNNIDKFIDVIKKLDSKI